MSERVANNLCMIAKSVYLYKIVSNYNWIVQNFILGKPIKM